jgi:HEPN domain-containing protein
MSPSTYQEWLRVANERAADASAMLKDRNDSAGPVYMAGYVIECSLKALLQRRGIAFPRAGREGHNLRGLWNTARLRLTDIRDTTGEKAFFIEYWSTDLRYEVQLEIDFTAEELVRAAAKLSGWLQTLVRQRRGRL